MILRYDGVSWTPQKSVTTIDLNGIWGGSATGIYVVGATGTILRFADED